MKTSVNEVEVSDRKTLIPIKLEHSWIAIKYHEPTVIRDGEASSQLIEGSTLHRPATAKEDYSKGTVMSIGPGEPGYPIDIEPGWEVTYFRQEARRISVDSKDYDLVTHSQIIMVL